MQQKEIRDKVENLIRMNQTFSGTRQEFKALDLAPIFDQFFTPEAKNIIQNHRTNDIIHQWNRVISDNKYLGTEACALGYLLDRLDLKNYADFQQCNYVRDISRVEYFGYTCDRVDLVDAALSLVSFFNDLASRNLIRAVMTPLLSIELVDGRCVVVSYVAIDQPNEALVQSTYGHLIFKEGGIPSEFK